MSDIFISYANEDRSRTQMLAESLETQGWSIFWDQAIRSGQTWRQVIEKELGEARCVIVLWTKYSIVSDYVPEEAENGRKRNILIPVKLEDVQPPLGFQSIQTADLVDWKSTEPSQEFSKLIADIGTLIEPSTKFVEVENVNPEVHASEQKLGNINEIPSIPNRQETQGDTSDANAVSTPTVVSFTSDFGLSGEAIELLLAAAEDRGGTIIHTNAISGRRVQTDRKTFGEPGNRRSIARWEFALNQLVEAECIVEMGYKDELFEVTELGYQMADAIRDVSS